MDRPFLVLIRSKVCLYRELSNKLSRVVIRILYAVDEAFVKQSIFQRSMFFNYTYFFQLISSCSESGSRIHHKVTIFVLDLSSYGWYYNERHLDKRTVPVVAPSIF